MLAAVLRRQRTASKDRRHQEALRQIVSAVQLDCGVREGVWRGCVALGGGYGLGFGEGIWIGWLGGDSGEFGF